VSYLIDTNALSELRRKQPDAYVVRWFELRGAQSLYISVLTLGEIRKGIDGLENLNGQSARRQALNDWLEHDLPTYFLGRVLTIDAVIADRWGQLQATAKRPLPAIDSLLAATALHHNLSLVTRNVRDFEGLGVLLVNPWDDQSQ